MKPPRTLLRVLSEDSLTEVTFSIEPLPHAIQAARERVVALVEGQLDTERREELRLVVSEVVTNAVRHGTPAEDVHVRVLICDGYLCVKVTDAGAGIAPRPRATAPTDDGGFGLMLVECFTRRWGMTREAGRTRIWFEFDLA